MAKMKIDEFNKLIGNDSYVRCSGKKRIDSSIANLNRAKAHLFSGGQIGWWVTTGYIVVDIDEGKEEAIEVVKRLGIKTLMAKSPKGIHLYFKCKETYAQKVGMTLPCGLKCDFRCANKGYVVLPFGSEGRSFNKCREIAEMPPEMTPLIGRSESLYQLKEGDGRNEKLFGHLMAYRNRGATQEQVEEMGHIINELILDEPLDEKELTTIINNTDNYPKPENGSNQFLIYNEKGKPSQINSRALSDYFVNRGDIFVLGSEVYIYKDGVYREGSSEIRNFIRELVVVDRLITQPRIMEAYKLIVDDTRIRRSPSEINSDPNLINFKNGVWDIQEQRLLPHDPKYLQTIQIPHEVGNYKPFKQTKFYNFIRKTDMPKEDAMMILKYIAYCMTIGYGLKTFMVLLGKSNTGKSVLIRFIESMIGKENTSALSMHELNMKFYPTQLYGKLVNACADNNSLPLQSIDMLKKITGGDQIMHEKKGKEPFFFVPFSKLIFSFNQMPLQLEEKSNAFYKRMRILHMDKELFLNDKYVNELCDEGVEELIPYLLTLLPVTKIPRTKRSNRLVETLRRDSDSIHAFIEVMCEIGEDESVSVDVLYEAYSSYCVKLGREAHRKHGFIRTLSASGYRQSRGKWLGLSLKR